MALAAFHSPFYARRAAMGTILLAFCLLVSAGCDSNSDGGGEMEARTAAPDTTVPAVPQSVTAAAEGDEIAVAWEAGAADDDLASYHVARGPSAGEVTPIDTVDAAVTSYDDEAVSEGTTYHYRVRAVDEAGNASDYSPAAQATLDLPAPAGLNAAFDADAGEGGAVMLGWDAVATEGLTGYGIYRGLDDMPTTQIEAVEANSPAYTDLDVEEGQTYFYRVTALKDGMESSFSGVARIAVPDQTPPPAPTGFSAEAGDGEVRLGWTPVEEEGVGVEAYRLRRGTEPEPTEVLAEIGAEAASYTDTGTENGATYYYRLTAVDSAGNESESAGEVSATPEDGAAPLAPSGLRAEADEDTVALRWDAVEDEGLAAYRVFRGPAPAPTEPLVEVEAGQTAYADTDVETGQTYYYRLTSVGVSGNESGFSESVSATPQDRTAPPVPQMLTAEAEDGEIRLDWQDVDDAGLTEYRLYRGPAPEPTDRLASTGPEETTYTDADVDPGQTYYYRVTAADQAGNESAFSGEASAVTDAALSAECTGGTADGYPCENVDLVARLSRAELIGASSGGGPSLAEVWGWTDPQTGRRYALVGRADGTSFVDVTEPAAPALVGSLPSAAGASDWRDIKVKNDHALIGSEARGHGMQIFDLTELRDVDVEDAPQTFEATAVYDGFGSSHNIVTAGEGTARAYGVGLSGVQEPSRCGAGYHAVDLSNPAEPQFGGCFSASLGGRVAPGYTHDAQCVTYDGPDDEHQGQEICVGADESGLSVSDLTDPSAGEELAVATYPNTGYTHQGWFGPEQRYFYLDDELDERNRLTDRTRTLVWDMTDLDDPVLVTQYAGEATSIDHNQYLIGDRAYQANYTGGLRILDTSDKEDPREVGFFDVYPQSDAASFDGAWGTYPFFDDGIVLISGIGSGLFIVRPTGPATR